VRSRRLLFFSPLPPPAGGIATWTQAVLASALRERFELHVIDTSPSQKVDVSGGSRLRFDRLSDALRSLARFVRELARIRPEIVHVNTSYHWAFWRDGLALWLAKLSGAKTVMHFRGGTFPQFVETTPPAFRWLIPVVLRGADRLFALDSGTREWLEKVCGSERTRFVPNFVDPAEFTPIPNRAARCGPVAVLFVGWIIEGKGVRELLEAGRGILEARFTLIGPADPEFLEQMRPDLEALGERARVLPPRRRRDVIDLYRAADVFVLPSWREGFPNVILEAMAAGLPIIATPVGAIADVVRDGREGLLVPSRDSASLAKALERMVRDRELRLKAGRRGRARVEAEFSCDAVIHQLGDLYEELEPRAGAPSGMGSSME
jgi:glycosyltransferase involved in cell wall biosynthesis